MIETCAIILAAGEGTRMKSKKPKVLAQILFRPMLKWAIDSIEEANIKDICVVAGYRYDIIEEYLGSLGKKYFTSIQNQRKGTAHAVMCADDFLRNNIEKHVLIMGADSPFMDSKTIKEAYCQHIKEENSVTVISAKVEDPYGYGRIVRYEKDGKLKAIVEQKDANEKTNLIDEVNSGAYWFCIKDLLEVLYEIEAENAQQEFYLPDAIKLLLEQGKNVNSYFSENSETVLGANNCEQLFELNQIARERVFKELYMQGVNIPCKDGIMIEPGVIVNSDTTILPGTILKGKTIISKNCIIGPNTYIEDSKIAENLVLNSVYCYNKSIVNQEQIMPFSALK